MQKSERAAKPDAWVGPESNDFELDPPRSWVLIGHSEEHTKASFHRARIGTRFPQMFYSLSHAAHSRMRSGRLGLGDDFGAQENHLTTKPSDFM